MNHQTANPFVLQHELNHSTIENHNNHQRKLLQLVWECDCVVCGKLELHKIIQLICLSNSLFLYFFFIYNVNNQKVLE